MVPEARMERSEAGLVAASGWFVVNVRDAAWVSGGHFADACVFEGDAAEERRLEAWDFVHCPPGTEHIFVGAGDGPCVIFMAGARTAERDTLYVRSELALRHGAGVEADTTSSREAYAPFRRWQPGPPASYDGLAWALR